MPDPTLVSGEVKMEKIAIGASEKTGSLVAANADASCHHMVKTVPMGGAKKQWGRGNAIFEDIAV